MADAPHRAEIREVVDPQAPMRRSPLPEAALDTEALKGEHVLVEESNAEGWCRGRLEADGYAGWLPANALAAPGPAATHKVRPSKCITAKKILMWPSARRKSLKRAASHRRKLRWLGY